MTLARVSSFSFKHLKVSQLTVRHHQSAPVGSLGLLLLLWSTRTNKSDWFTLYVTGMRFVHTSCKYFKKKHLKKKKKKKLF